MNARWGLAAGMISPRRQRVLADSPVSILAVHPALAAATERADARSYFARTADQSH